MRYLVRCRVVEADETAMKPRGAWVLVGIWACPVRLRSASVPPFLPVFWRRSSRNAGYAELEPYQSATGDTTTLSNTVFSTVPGAPVFVGKAPSYRSKNEKLGIDLNMKNHNALQSTFAFNC